MSTIQKQDGAFGVFSLGLIPKKMFMGYFASSLQFMLRQLLDYPKSHHLIQINSVQRLAECGLGGSFKYPGGIDLPSACP